MSLSPVRLTDLAHGGGCGCKLAPSVLQQLLADQPQAAAYAQLLVGTETGDDAWVAFPKLKQWARDLNTMLGQIFPTRSLQAPVTGFSITPGAGITQLVLNPAGTLAAGTITMPPSPGDNQPFTVLTSQTITAATFNANAGQTLNGAPTTLAANTAVKWIYEAALSTWFRSQ